MDLWVWGDFGVVLALVSGLLFGSWFATDWYGGCFVVWLRSLVDVMLVLGLV